MAIGEAETKEMIKKTTKKKGEIDSFDLNQTFKFQHCSGEKIYASTETEEQNFLSLLLDIFVAMFIFIANVN